MGRLCFVTDSTADIPKELAEKWNIHIVPLRVHIDNECYLDGVSITPQVFFEKLAQSERFPTTSQPTPHDFEKTYREIAKQYGPEVQILSVHLSSALSGTFQSANVAKRMLEDLDITVIDSKKCAFLLGMMVIEAAKAADGGKGKDECLKLIYRMIAEQKEFFVVDTLAYMHKGGRIGKAQALIGSLLNIKPILSLNQDGEVFPFDKIRGKKKAVLLMLEELKKYAEDEKVICSVIYATNLNEAEDLKQKILQEFRVDDVNMVEIGPVIGSHVGPHVLAVGMFKP